MNDCHLVSELQSFIPIYSMEIVTEAFILQIKDALCEDGIPVGKLKTDSSSIIRHLCFNKFHSFGAQTCNKDLFHLP